ncbi:putative membrane protein [Halobacteriovorax marinus SJ]|uniref:Membrane protein n=1 Tax=Halobacteriovorax marinus (strain ATCC BAA-682 / DSM 15412 / SJ) TaxID=862908 RepID=E1X3I7_HALMS|nr:MipA/OmpV family protein [Halobacteriovorax marinus]CBW26916.1 putative membrane protein [Halobacteriovorax marinus SJ]
MILKLKRNLQNSLRFILCGVLFFIILNSPQGVEGRNLNDEKPLFELGVGVGSALMPHYPASDQSQTVSLILPTFRYRGRVFRVDEEDGVRARVLSSPSFGIEFTGAGNLPVSSSENTTRAGMPDLDILGEIGPQFYLKAHQAGELKARLLFPIRGALSTDFSSIHYRGIVFSPGFDLHIRLPSTFGSLKLLMNVNFASKEYHKFFFDVSREFSNQDRPEYESAGGYLGTQSAVSYIGDWKRLGVFIQAGYQNYQNSRNESSPLFKQKHTFTGFIGIRWLLYHSDSMEDDRI